MNDQFINLNNFRKALIEKILAQIVASARSIGLDLPSDQQYAIQKRLEDKYEAISSQGNAAQTINSLIEAIKKLEPDGRDNFPENFDEALEASALSQELINFINQNKSLISEEEKTGLIPHLGAPVSKYIEVADSLVEIEIGIKEKSADFRTQIESELNSFVKKELKQLEEMRLEQIRSRIS